MRWLLLLLGVLGAGASLAQEQRMFKDWVVSCDNTRHCTAIGLSRIDDPAYAYLRFERSGAPNAEVESIRIELAESIPPTGTWSLWAEQDRLFEIDARERQCGEPYGPNHCAAVSIQDPTHLKAIFDAFRVASFLSLVVDQGAVAAVSLEGASASLLWIDELQKRLGTATAFIRKGPHGLERIPQPPAPPELRLQTGAWSELAEAEVAKLLPQLSHLIPSEACDHDPVLRPFSDRAWRHRDGQLLVQAFCYGGAYNYSSIWFLGTSQRAWRTAQFPLPPKLADASDSAGTLVNAEFDPATGVLTSFNKGRGLGDCGQETSWGWTGQGFVLLEMRAMNECRAVGPDAWPVLYRSQWR